MINSPAALPKPQLQQLWQWLLLLLPWLLLLLPAQLLRLLLLAAAPSSAALVLQTALLLRPLQLLSPVAGHPTRRAAHHSLPVSAAYSLIICS